MSEYRFDFRPPAEPGRAVFRVRNVGKVPHRLTLLPLEEDIPPILQQLRGDQRRVISPFAGIPDRRPGGTGVFAADLEPGRRYAVICFVVDPDPQTGQPTSHAIRGMATEFRAPGVRARQDTTTTVIPEGGAATTVPEAADSTTATEPAPTEPAPTDPAPPPAGNP